MKIPPFPQFIPSTRERSYPITATNFPIGNNEIPIIKKGEKLTFIIRPDKVFRASGIVVADDATEKLMITGIRVGRHDQLAISSPIPAAIFSSHVTETASNKLAMSICEIGIEIAIDFLATKDVLLHDCVCFVDDKLLTNTIACIKGDELIPEGEKS